MSKPEWNEDTPKWANWLAKDRDGFWWWYETEPIPSTGYEWVASVRGTKVERSSRFDSRKIHWKKTKEPRP